MVKQWSSGQTVSGGLVDWCRYFRNFRHPDLAGK
jgi:hypothetical protein